VNFQVKLRKKESKPELSLESEEAYLMLKRIIGYFPEVGKMDRFLTKFDKILQEYDFKSFNGSSQRDPQ